MKTIYRYGLLFCLLLGILFSLSSFSAVPMTVSEYITEVRVAPKTPQSKSAEALRLGIVSLSVFVLTPAVAVPLIGAFWGWGWGILAVLLLLALVLAILTLRKAEVAMDDDAATLESLKVAKKAKWLAWICLVLLACAAIAALVMGILLAHIFAVWGGW